MEGKPMRNRKRRTWRKQRWGWWTLFTCLCTILPRRLCFAKRNFRNII